LRWCLAVETTGGDLPIFTILMGLFGGLGLFLFGMDLMSTALKAVAGDRMKFMLARLTTNRFTGALTGAAVTAAVQSSSITTVLVVGFVSAGLMTLTQSIGVIFGANIGTTITTQIVAFKVTKLALLMIAVGYGIMLIGRADRVRESGRLVLGLGLIFFGMTVMGEGVAPLRAWPAFPSLMVRLANPLLGILVGAAFTAVVQSSSATTGIVIALAQQGLITLPAGIALALGANLGTCVTAVLASIGRPREAVRAAGVHVAFNLAGVLLWVGLIDQLAAMAAWLSPSSQGLTGAERLAADAPRQIANAHTIFNVANTVVLIWFAGPLGRWLHRVLPDRPVVHVGPRNIQPQHLDENLLATPALALVATRREIGRMGRIAHRAVRRILAAALRGDEVELDAVHRLHQDVDNLHGPIIRYLGQVSERVTLAERLDEVQRLMDAANALEHIGNIVETNLIAQGRLRLDAGLEPSQPTVEMLAGFHRSVTDAVETAVKGLRREDPALAGEVVAMKPRIDEMAEALAEHQRQRLIADAPARVQTYRLETDVAENLKRIYYFADRIARSVSSDDESEG